jgi:hypothetical protein
LCCKELNRSTRRSGLYPFVSAYQHLQTNNSGTTRTILTDLIINEIANIDDNRQVK